MKTSSLLAIKLLFVVLCIKYSEAHGSLRDPPARSSAWRYDSRFPINYTDMEMNCGGISVQWQKNGGKCSICGEDFSKPKLYDRGGSRYTGINVRNYKKGQTIDVLIDMVANHIGWFEFRICNVDGSTTEATQACLDRTVLKDTSGQSRFNIRQDQTNFRYKLVLPSSLSCKHCVFQWKYNTGNRWDTDRTTGQSCVGCGPQEQFYGCADVSVL